MPNVPCFIVDAFTSRPFGGNPAAVCWLDREASDAWMQRVAAEFNLSETAFVRERNGRLHLRWFTPSTEVDLCGHATLATAHALWTSGLALVDPLVFDTKSGLLTCRRDGELIELDFPATPATPCDTPADLVESLGVDPSFVGRTLYDYFVVVRTADEVRNATPDFARLAKVNCRGAIVTAKSDTPDADFVSRFFAPAVQVNEDPVCGSAHCAMGPYWVEQLQRTELRARQVSARVGEIRVRLVGDRVLLGGRAVMTVRGELAILPE
jgi:PhzF family phenazine biosynthesis protein